MAYQYSYGGLQDTLGRLESIAGFNNGSAWLPAFSPGDAMRFRNAQMMLPYAAQQEQARQQQRAAEDADRRRYQYQYGV